MAIYVIEDMDELQQALANCLIDCHVRGLKNLEFSAAFAMLMKLYPTARWVTDDSLDAALFMIATDEDCPYVTRLEGQRGDSKYYRYEFTTSGAFDKRMVHIRKREVRL